LWDLCLSYSTPSAPDGHRGRVYKVLGYPKEKEEPPRPLSQVHPNL
jgi:hypothetical protein